MKSEREAFQWAERAASLKFAPGLYELANCLEQGIGVPKDLERAIALYEDASDAGFGFATQRLGRAYYAGEFGERDLQKAVEYMKRAIDLGEPLAALNLGEWYSSGEMLPRNHEAAIQWYEVGSKLGNPLASLQLSMAYFQGELGLPRDHKLARQYEDLAKKQS